MAKSPFDPKGKEAATAASNPALSAVLKLAEEARQLEEGIAEQDEILSSMSARYNAIKQKEMPDAMAEAGLADFTTPDGINIKIADFVSGSLPKEETLRKEAIEWLEAHEAGELIKTNIELSFGKSQHNEALALADDLKAKGFAFEMGSGVHSGTLQSFAREKMKAGEEIPLDKLGLYSGRIAKVKLPKEKKAA